MSKNNKSLRRTSRIKNKKNTRKLNVRQRVKKYKNKTQKQQRGGVLSAEASELISTFTKRINYVLDYYNTKVSSSDGEYHYLMNMSNEKMKFILINICTEEAKQIKLNEFKDQNEENLKEIEKIRKLDKHLEDIFIRFKTFDCSIRKEAMEDQNFRSLLVEINKATRYIQDLIDKLRSRIKINEDIDEVLLNLTTNLHLCNFSTINVRTTEWYAHSRKVVNFLTSFKNKVCTLVDTINIDEEYATHLKTLKKFKDLLKLQENLNVKYRVNFVYLKTLKQESAERAQAEIEAIAAEAGSCDNPFDMGNIEELTAQLTSTKI